MYDYLVLKCTMDLFIKYHNKYVKQYLSFHIEFCSLSTKRSTIIIQSLCVCESVYVWFCLLCLYKVFRISTLRLLISNPVLLY